MSLAQDVSDSSAGGSKLFLRGIPKGRSEAQVKDELRRLFPSCTEIVVVMVTKTTNKGHAFVHFSSPEEASAAVDSYTASNKPILYEQTSELTVRQTLKQQAAPPPPPFKAESTSYARGGKQQQQRREEGNNVTDATSVTTRQSSSPKLSQLPSTKDDVVALPVDINSGDATKTTTGKISQEVEEEYKGTVSPPMFEALPPLPPPSLMFAKLVSSLPMTPLPSVLASYPVDVVAWLSETALGSDIAASKKGTTTEDDNDNDAVVLLLLDRMTAAGVLTPECRASIITVKHMHRKWFLVFDTTEAATGLLVSAHRRLGGEPNKTEDSSSSSSRKKASPVFGRCTTPRLRELFFPLTRSSSSSRQRPREEEGEYNTTHPTVDDDHEQRAQQKQQPVMLSEVLSIVQCMFRFGGGEEKEHGNKAVGAASGWVGAFRDRSGAIALVRAPGYAAGLLSEDPLVKK